MEGGPPSTLANLTDRRDDEDAESAEAYLQSVALLYTETLMQAVGERRYLPEPWQRASTTSDWHLRLTAARAEQLVDTLAALIERVGRRRTSEAEGIGDFVVNLNAFPRPGTVVTEGAER